MKKQWLDVIDDTVSGQHRQAVFDAVTPELAKLKQKAMDNAIPWYRRWQVQIAIPVFASLAFVLLNRFFGVRGLIDPVDQAAQTPLAEGIGSVEGDLEFFENLDLWTDFELIADLEVLEKWNPS